MKKKQYELQFYRMKKELTQQQMAEHLGISLSFLQKIETGNKTPSFYFIKKLKEKYPDFDANIFFNNELHSGWERRVDMNYWGLIFCTGTVICTMAGLIKLRKCL